MAITNEGQQTGSAQPSARRRLVTDSCVAVALALALGLVFALDPKGPSAPPPMLLPEEVALNTSTPPSPPPPPPPVLPTLPPADPTPRLRIETMNDGRFGVSTLSGNPDDPSDDNKQITFSTIGATNNTRVLVDGQTPLFGGSEGTVSQSLTMDATGARVMTWEYHGVRVRQTVRLIAGEVSRRTDSVRVTYRLENTGTTAHNVGLRVMLDTLIGGNDGVPFLVPGRAGLVTDALTLDGPAVPDYVQSLENPSLDRPGVVVDIGVSPGEGEDRPDTLTLTHWPGSSADWMYNRSGSFSDDSAVGLYYNGRTLPAGGVRSMGFTYGLGSLSSTTTGNAGLSLTTSGAVRAVSSFWLMVLVKNPKAGQSVTLTLPPGLSPKTPASPRQSVTAGGAYTQLSWLIEVAPTALGRAEVIAALEPAGLTERLTLNVQPPDLALSLLPRGPFRAGQPFWVSTVVRAPRAGQTVTLELANGLTLASGHAAAQSVSADALSKASGGYVQLNWLVVPAPRVEGRRTLKARLTPDGTDATAEIDISPASLTQ